MKSFNLYGINKPLPAFECKLEIFMSTNL